MRKIDKLVNRFKISNDLLSLAREFERFCENRTFFYTGSIVYGPTPCRDIDVVMDPSHKDDIVTYFTDKGYKVKEGTYFVSLRIFPPNTDSESNLNVILLCPKEARNWKSATDVMHVYFCDIRIKSKKIMVFDMLKAAFNSCYYGDDGFSFLF